MNPIQGAFGDAADFRAIFFEEADEHVAAIEGILLGLNLAAPAAEDLNAIFRAAHSIKGTSGMLGFSEIASLTHVLENLLDDLRKGERALTEQTLDLMLRAGDTVKLQVAHRRGVLAEPPDASGVEAELRELSAGAASEGAGASPARRYSVRLGPLAAPIDQAELDLTLAGLAELGKVSTGAMRNEAGGEIAFDVELAGAEADLRSVLAMVCAPEAIHIAKHVEAATAPAAAAAQGGGELFHDPGQWKRRREARTGPAVDLFVTPDEWHAQGKRRAAVAARPRSPGRRATDAGGAVERLGRRETDRQLPGVIGDSSSIRVGIDKVDRLVNLVGELVITQAMLAQQLGGAEAGSRLASGLADLTRHARNLQEAVMSIRMVPISAVFTRFPRLVRELSQRFGKEVELKVSGEATELDRGLIEKITDPLLHLVRNAIDHGIEPREERIAAGKPACGTIVMSASHKSGKIVIEVRDDGRGLCREKILARAAQRGNAISPGASDAEVWQLIFEPGFSTAETVTEVSGRGVGMDVVRRNIQVLGGGAVELQSREGAGTSVTVSVPLTLAIMDAMLVGVGGETFVLPLAAIIESRRVAPGEIRGIAGQGYTLRVRDEFLPVARLRELFAVRGVADSGGGEVAVIVESDGGKAALLVDDVLGQQQVVVKSLEANFRRVQGVSSATIMGDGRVALILDLAQVVQFATRAARVLH
jgi:two-component system chemotaxis sensor kinase CheA